MMICKSFHLILSIVILNLIATSGCNKKGSRVVTREVVFPSSDESSGDQNENSQSSSGESLGIRERFRKKAKKSLCKLKDENAIFHEFCEDPEEYPIDLALRIIEQLKNGASATVQSQAFFGAPLFVEEEDDNLTFVRARPQGRPNNRPNGGGPNRRQRPRPNQPNRKKQKFPAFSQPRLPPKQDKDEGVLPINAESQDNDESEEKDVEYISSFDVGIAPTKAASGGNNSNNVDISLRFGGNQTSPVEEPEIVPDTADFVTSEAERPQMFIRETPLCDTRSQYIYPKRAKNKADEYRYILNVPNTEYVQVVRIETCSDPGTSCRLQGGLRFSDFGVRTVCRQKYTYRKMMAISDNGEEEVDLFKFPSACVCHQVEETPFFPHSSASFSSRIAVPRNSEGKVTFEEDSPLTIKDGFSTSLTDLKEEN